MRERNADERADIGKTGRNCGASSKSAAQSGRAQLTLFGKEGCTRQAMARFWGSAVLLARVMVDRSSKVFERKVGGVVDAAFDSPSAKTSPRNSAKAHCVAAVGSFMVMARSRAWTRLAALHLLSRDLLAWLMYLKVA